jgi:mannose-6-phosphate isomerase
MELLQPVIRPYDWGSRHGIAELQGRPVPTPGPEAELWMGAHPSAPAGVAATTLDAVIAADPDGQLGPDCVARFGPRLPFLLKVLSADRALSIQVHPSRAQAETGFRAENERGVGPAVRNYVDDWPKPELLCALTPFEVLAGLRTPSDAAALLRALGVPQLAPLAAGLEAATSPTSLSRALAAILTWPDPEGLVRAVVAACRSLAAAAPGSSAGSPDGSQPPGPGRYAAACAAVLRAADDYPADRGVAAMLLLRHAVLAPGQAMFMPAGGLHAYLRGTGVELLANSDNVVRAGLTGKHIDVPELLKLVDPAVAVPVLSAAPVSASAVPASPVPASPGSVPAADGQVRWFDTPAPEFRLYVADLPDGEACLPGRGPRIVLCASGSATLLSDRDEIKLARGESCFIAASDGPLRACGPGRLFLAAPGDPPAP